MIGMIGHAERIIFCEGTYTRKHLVPELCACIKVRAPRTGTNWPSINVCRGYNDLYRQPSLCRSKRSAWFNAPWFFLWGQQQQQWIGRGGPVARPLLADRCCDDIKHAMRHRADCLNTYCKNMPFSIKWYVYNCLHSIPTLTGEHLHLSITHKRHVCDYVFLHKKWSSLHILSSLSFCRWGPVTPCIIKRC